MYYIYVIQNKVNNKIYVGQTKNFKTRKSRHKYEALVKLNKKPLYQSIRKYGFESFNFIEIDSAPAEEIDDLEIFWIQFFESNKRERGYNLSNGGKPLKDSKIIKNRKPPMLGKKHSNETKIKMSLDRQGEKNNFYGKQHSVQSKIKMSKNDNRKYFGDANYFSKHKYVGSSHGNSKLKEQQVLDIRYIYQEKKLNYEELAKIFNVSPSTVSRIIQRKVWTHI